MNKYSKYILVKQFVIKCDVSRTNNNAYLCEKMNIK